MSFLGKNMDKLNHHLESIFIIFIILQPLLDIVAFWGIKISIIVRFFAMALGFIYIVMYPDRKYKRYSIAYILILGAFMVVHLVNNMIFKESFALSAEINYIVKTVYFLMMLIIYVLIFKSLSTRDNWQKVIQRNVTIALGVIGVAMLIASLTETGRRSYSSLAKLGHSGWFYSANELSAILAMALGIMILFLIGRKKMSTKLIVIPFIFLVLWSMLTIGTKVGLGAVIVILLISVFLSFIEIIKDRSKWVNSLLLVVIALVTIIILPHTPVGNNMKITFDLFPDTENEGELTGEDIKLGDLIDEPDNQMEVVDPTQEDEKAKPTTNLLSGRGDFFNNQLSQFKDAPISQKIFGMGYAGNYKEVPKLIEMDFFDYFFNFGILGFIILLTPLLLLGCIIIINLLRKPLKQINTTSLILIIEIGLGLGVAFFAGHILTAPAAGFYLAILISYLYVMTLQTLRKNQQPF